MSSSIIKRFRENFVSSDEEQTHDSYPYNIPVLAHVEIEKFIITEINDLLYDDDCYEYCNSVEDRRMNCNCDAGNINEVKKILKKRFNQP